MPRHPTTINWPRITPHLRRLKTNLERELIDPASYPMRLLDLFMEHGEAPSIEVAEHYVKLAEASAFTGELMDQLVDRAKAKIADAADLDAAHCRVCDEIADEFDLWDGDDRFPTWLSRVVAGVIEDWKWERTDDSDPKPTFRSAEAEASGSYPSTELEGGFEGEGEEVE